jgi:hypothetical protein
MARFTGSDALANQDAALERIQELWDRVDDVGKYYGIPFTGPFSQMPEKSRKMPALIHKFMRELLLRVCLDVHPWFRLDDGPGRYGPKRSRAKKGAKRPSKYAGLHEAADAIAAGTPGIQAPDIIKKLRRDVRFKGIESRRLSQELSRQRAASRRTATK